MRTAYYLYVGGYEGRIHLLTFTPPTGDRRATLSQESDEMMTRSAGKAPTWLTLSTDLKTLYATDEWGEPTGELSAYAIDETSRALTRLSSVSSSGLWPCHSALVEGATPKKLITVNYKGRSIISQALKDDGDFATDVEPEIHSLEGIGEPGPHSWRQTQQHPHEAHIDPTGTMVVVPDLGTDDLRIFLISTDGKLSHHTDVALRPGSGPRHVVFSSPSISSSTTLYVLNELSNSISVLRVTYSNPSGPSFELLQDSLSTLPPSPVGTQSRFDHWHAAEIKLHPSGRWLYASNRAEDHDPLHGSKGGEPDSIVIFPIDLETGELREPGRKLMSSGGKAPRHFAFSSESHAKAGTKDKEKVWVAVAAHDSDEVIVSEVSEEDGTWSEVARLNGVGRPGVALWA